MLATNNDSYEENKRKRKLENEKPPATVNQIQHPWLELPVLSPLSYYHPTTTRRPPDDHKTTTRQPQAPTAPYMQTVARVCSDLFD